MQKNLFRLTSRDSIRAQIQREEIDRIIQEQKRRKEQQNIKSISQISFVHKQTKSNKSRERLPSHPLFTSRQKVSVRKRALPEEAIHTSYNLNDQISRFSVKRHYEKIINSVRDESLAKQLKLQLFSPTSSRYKKGESDKTTNFFQKVFNKQSRIQKYFEHIKQHRKEFMNFHIEPQPY